MPENEVARVVQGTLLGEAILNAATAALVADDRGYYVAVNDAACTLTGYSRETLTEFRAGQLGADEASRRIYENLARGRKLQGRKLIRRSDGELVECRYSAIRTTISQLPYFVLLVWPRNAGGPG